MAVSTAMSICKIVFQTSFFIFFFPFFFSGSTFRKRQGRCAPLSFSPSVFQWLISHLPFLMKGSVAFLLTQCKDTKKIGKMQQLSRITCILVPNHVHPCQESRASLSRIPRIPLSSPSSWRRAANCIPTYRLLRRHVSPAASPRSFGGIGRTVTSCVGQLVDRRKGKNVNVNVNLKCFSMLPEGEAYNRV